MITLSNYTVSFATSKVITGVWISPSKSYINQNVQQFSNGIAENIEIENKGNTTEKVSIIGLNNLYSTQSNIVLYPKEKEQVAIGLKTSWNESIGKHINFFEVTAQGQEKNVTATVKGKIYFNVVYTPFFTKLKLLFSRYFYEILFISAILILGIGSLISKSKDKYNDFSNKNIKKIKM